MFNRAEADMRLAAKELARIYSRYNPKGNYLSVSIIRIGQDTMRIHINNAYYDRDHSKPVDITEDFTL